MSCGFPSKNASGMTTSEQINFDKTPSTTLSSLRWEPSLILPRLKSLVPAPSGALFLLSCPHGEVGNSLLARKMVLAHEKYAKFRAAHCLRRIAKNHRGLIEKLEEACLIDTLSVQMFLASSQAVVLCQLCCHLR